MNTLTDYLRQIVEPTLDDFKRNPASVRHAFLACVATYHAIDRVSYPKNAGNLRKKWRGKSSDFFTVDIVAHNFKHVRISDQRAPNRVIAAWPAMLGSMGLNDTMLNDSGVDVGYLIGVLERAINFLRTEIPTNES